MCADTQSYTCQRVQVQALHSNAYMYLGQVAEYSECCLGFLQSDPVPVGRGYMSEKNWEGLAGGHHLAALL